MKRSNAITIGLLNLLALGGGILLSNWLWRDAETTINAYQELYVTARTRADLLIWRQALETSAPDRAAIAAAFVTRSGLIKFIEELESVGRESGVDLTLSEPVIETQSLKLSLDVRGQFSNLYRFLARLENLPYQLVFNQVNLTTTAGWRGELDLTLTSFIDDYGQQ